jgi:catechol 2,3-dioxygenase-like lactoylglutathione lyase family enzyme
MQKVYLTLRITDYEKSKAFYVDGLGFQIETAGGYPELTSVAEGTMLDNLHKSSKLFPCLVC